MDLTLIRKEYREDGIFSSLIAESGGKIADTLEHSYDKKPKLPTGEYRCVRGKHRLHSMTQDFETFEITGVPDHSGILFHIGNSNKDSDGCVLLGATTIISPNGSQVIVKSKVTFQIFMELQKDINEFQLTVR